MELSERQELNPWLLESYEKMYQEKESLICLALLVNSLPEGVATPKRMQLSEEDKRSFSDFTLENIGAKVAKAVVEATNLRRGDADSLNYLWGIRDTFIEGSEYTWYKFRKGALAFLGVSVWNREKLSE